MLPATPIHFHQNFVDQYNIENLLNKLRSHFPAKSIFLYSCKCIVSPPQNREILLFLCLSLFFYLHIIFDLIQLISSSIYFRIDFNARPQSTQELDILISFTPYVVLTGHLKHPNDILVVHNYLDIHRLREKYAFSHRSHI